MRRALPILSLTLAVGTAFAAHAAIIEYIAHACSVIESDAGERVLIDPFCQQSLVGL